MNFGGARGRERSVAKAEGVGIADVPFPEPEPEGVELFLFVYRLTSPVLDLSESTLSKLTPTQSIALVTVHVPSGISLMCPIR
jgi:hypothetical protein